MNDRYSGEHVLVFPTSILHEAGTFTGYRTHTVPYLERIFAPGVLRFMPRSQAEDDPTYKQIIPYVVFADGDRVFSYVRGTRSGERRLVGNRSIGIGGHVNPIDATTGAAVDRTTYFSAVAREIDEEVVVSAPIRPDDTTIAAVLNDDSNAVGRVHFGIIHVCAVPDGAVRPREDQIRECGFTPIADLQRRREELETWSQYALDLVASRS